MFSTPLRPVLTLSCLVVLTVSVARADRDPLTETRERLKIEAQRIEQEFTQERALAYNLVRRDDPRLVEATEKLHTLLAMVRNDTSLETQRREVLIVTLKADLDRVRDIASQRRRVTMRRDEETLRSAVSNEIRGRDQGRQLAATRQISDEVRSIQELRSRAVVDARKERLRYADRFNKVMSSVDESAIPEHRDVRFPKDWVEKSKKRSAAAKLTAKEKAILKALSSPITVDFDKKSFEDVISELKAATGIEILVDRRALDEMSVSYESPVTLKLKASTRTVLKRLLADLNLTYVIKDEAIQITSRERANQMTTTRAYYIGDLAAVVDLRIPPEISQLMMMETVNRIITSITQSVDPQSWKVNNPEAVGAIVFDPITMTLVVRQTAEIHYMIGGYR